MRLIDTHAHLDGPEFDGDRTEVLARAAANGVDRIVIIGYRPSGWDRAIQVARSFPGGRVCLGIHPAHSDEFNATTLDALRSSISGAPDVVVGVGETGIDLFRPGPSLDRQRAAFGAQLALSAELGLPTVIHQRAAEDECLAVLNAADTSQAIVLHSFDAGPETARTATARGWIIGVGGLMTRSSSLVVREIVRDYPLDRLVLETDSPYLIPRGIKARRNEPANTSVIAHRLAELRRQPVETIAEVTTRSAERAFPGL